MKTKPKTPSLKLVAPLPVPMTELDLTRPNYASKAKREQLIDDWQNASFDMHYTERFGWCIPTLLIRNPPRYSPGGSRVARTYAVSTKDGSVCTIGLGPHIKQTVRVFVRKCRAEALAPILKLREQGEEDANAIRDRIGTRRARTALLRAADGWQGHAFESELEILP